jgi:xanthine dehydrogenase YagS FAD-binding subunit
MNDFSFSTPLDPHGAIQKKAKSSHFIAGGTNLLDLMKERITNPQELIDLNSLGLKEISESEGGVRIGAMVTNADCANHPFIEKKYPLLSKAILAGASPQLRNMATTGGNLLQRTRCYYFYDLATPCNKRQPGSGCGALKGINRIHAILGASEECIAVHPSDMCVGLRALNAIVEVEGKSGKRFIPIEDFHRLPGKNPELDNTLKDDELILSVHLPKESFPKYFHYLKVRDRTSYAFAIVSAAVAIELKDNKIEDIRVALGGVAHKPWRDEGLEKSLVGQIPSRKLFENFAQAMMKDARGFEHNRFKIDLAKSTIIRSIEEALKGKEV